jgi:hypothetical protein
VAAVSPGTLSTPEPGDMPAAPGALSPYSPSFAAAKPGFVWVVMGSASLVNQRRPLLAEPETSAVSVFSSSEQVSTAQSRTKSNHKFALEVPGPDFGGFLLGPLLDADQFHPAQVVQLHVMRVAVGAVCCRL